MHNGESRRRVLRCERLEERDVPAVVPVGPEFRVNSTTTVAVGEPAVALDGDGDFVVAWQALGFDGSDNAVLAQRYTAFGAPLGGEFQVNTFVVGSQQNPAVAADENGRFVVVWGSASQQDGSREGVYARVYDNAGQPLTGEIQVNQFTLNIQGSPSVDMDQDGDFVVAWETNYQDGDGYGIYARRFNALGEPRGNEFAVNQANAGDQRFPAVACDNAGNFTIAWQSEDGDISGIAARRYAANGDALANEFAVNQTTINEQAAPTIAADADGDFVIAWSSRLQDAGTSGVYARRFSAAGAALGSEFRVNTCTTDEQVAPAITANAAGEFTITWQSFGQDIEGWGIFAQHFYFDGTPVGGEFRVPVTTSGHQTRPAIAADHQGNFVVAWASDQNPMKGIIAQRFANPPIPTAVVTIDDGHPQRSNIRDINIVFNTLMHIAPGAITLNGPVGPVTLNIDDSPSSNTQTTVRITFSGPSAVPAGLITGNYTFAIFSLQVTNYAGERLDADNNGTPGPNLVINFHRLFGDMDADRDVDANDFAFFRRYLGVDFGSPGYRHYVDGDADGDIDIGDFALFRNAFGGYLPES